MSECIWIFSFSICFFVISIGVAYRGYYVSVTDPEEPRPDEDDYEYVEDLGDDNEGAPRPTQPRSTY